MEYALTLIFNKITSSNTVEQRDGLIELDHLLKDEKTQSKEVIASELIRTASFVNASNNFYLFGCLEAARSLGMEQIEPAIVQELKRRGTKGIVDYLNAIKFLDQFSNKAVNYCLSVLTKEKKNPDNPNMPYIDDALSIVFGLLYLTNPDLVTSIIQKEIKQRKFLKFPDGFFWYCVQKRGTDPIIEMIESEMGTNKFYFNVIEFEQLFKTDKEKLTWCEKWANNPLTQWIVIPILSSILNRVKKTNNEVEKRAIDLVKKIASMNNVDYDVETHHIRKEPEAIKALYILKMISIPPKSIDTEQLEKILKIMPYCCQAYGKDWLLASDNMVTRIIVSADPKVISHIENIFYILDRYGIKIPQDKLHGEKDCWDILCEAELMARLAPHFIVTPEPIEKNLPGKRLDIKIEHNGEVAIIELATVYDLLEVQLSNGGGIPGGKVKHALKAKLNKQLSDGKKNPKIPIFLAANLEGWTLDDWSTADSIYGQFTTEFIVNTQTGEKVSSRNIRKRNGFYHLPGTEVVTGVLAYKRDEALKDPLVGRLYRNPNPVLNPVSLEFWVRLRDAIFGESETSEKSSLLEVPGIDESLADEIYKAGIEDIVALSTLDLTKVQVNSISNDKLIELQQKANEILNNQDIA